MDKKNLLSQMTLEEKASLCSGADFWHMKEIKRFGLPSVMMTDGPHGLRKQAEKSDHLGLNGSVPATCFPPAVTTASSWNTGKLEQVGRAIGEEARKEEVTVVLGPGANMKRSPLCGRNFEYFSEDPYLSGEMAAAWINGLQSENVGASLKHFAGNNQEKARLAENSVIDERTLREIYLTAFEKAVKQAQPWTVMCSYNRINNVYSCENQWLLTNVLRDEWGFEGSGVTDWGAMNCRTKALKAGLELEMPGPDGYNDNMIINAVREGQLDEAVLDRAVERLLEIYEKALKNRKKEYDAEAHHRLGREMAAESAVLLKNEDVLPLSLKKRYAVVGAFAQHPRYQGAGSSKINPHRIDSPLEELKKMGISCEYAPGYDLEKDIVDETLIQGAKEIAKEKDGVIVFAGLPDSYESEGFDRIHLDMPESHNALIRAMTEVNKNVIVVLMCGSVVLMPWRDRVQGILLAYLGGEAAGGACADLLTGRKNPSGKLAETFPLRLEDTPCYENFASEELDVLYCETLFVGYRYYDWSNKEVAYPFGYGLSYTEFEYSDMEVRWDDRQESGQVTLNVKNTGDCSGSEVVQLYIGKRETEILRAPKELKGFVKVVLEPGEEKHVTMILDKRSFAFYDTSSSDWVIEDGVYQVCAAASSRDIRCEQEISVSGVKVCNAFMLKPEDIREGETYRFTRGHLEALFGGNLPLISDEKRSLTARIKKVLEDKKGMELFGDIIQKSMEPFKGTDKEEAMLTMIYDLPLRGLVMFGATDYADIADRVEEWKKVGKEGVDN